MQTRTNLWLALGLTPADALLAPPIWAWGVLRAIDALFSPELKLDLPIEASVVFTRQTTYRDQLPFPIGLPRWFRKA